MVAIVIILIIILGILILLRVDYLRWKKSASRVMNEGEVIETMKGKIHYILFGKGPVLFFMHGGPGGIDQAFLLEGLVEEGYSVLSVSRPGYLRTPFIPLSYEEQVDQYVELLDRLEIDKVVVMGYSAGGPLALNFANKYPKRTHALVMEAGVSTVFEISSDASNSVWARLFLGDRIQDLLSWIAIKIMRIAFKMTLKSIIGLETLLDKEGIKEFADLVSHDKERRSWVMKLINTSVPMSIRKLGLDHDLELLTSIKEISVDEINVKSLLIYSRDDNDVKWAHAEYLQANLNDFELLETHGGHLMWVGKDMDKIKAKRVQFLNSLKLE